MHADRKIWGVPQVSFGETVRVQHAERGVQMELLTGVARARKCNLFLGPNETSTHHRQSLKGLE
jgi:hypothetical protein